MDIRVLTPGIQNYAQNKDNDGSQLYTTSRSNDDLGHVNCLAYHKSNKECKSCDYFTRYRRSIGYNSIFGYTLKSTS